MALKEVGLFSSDLDNTLVGKQGATRLFARCWAKCVGDAKTRNAKPPVLVYNTGRLLEDTLQLVRTSDLPKPDYLICGVGTSIYDYGKKSQLKAFAEILDEGWDLKKVKETVGSVFPDATPQPKHFQTPFKSSWYAKDLSSDDIEALESALEANDLSVNVVYSSVRDLDVIPQAANKGHALVWLLKHLKISASTVVVAGDTGNDSAMFEPRGIRGILVGNAQPELVEATVGRSVFHANRVCADGVIEGLIHYGLFSPSVEDDDGGDEYAPEIEHLLDETENPHTLADSERVYLRIAYTKAIEALRKNITPRGFSACSIADNESRGTDENYHSVWARDGSITLIGSLCLGNDPEMRECQRATLTTLLEHISPSGQIPANVSLTSGDPDYSGVGGICSIDSGIWTIIAFYEFVRATNDLDFLREYLPRLQRAMDWLSAHDSNNDALLEIPEAGDWTDLFGRSYNVLYDEVLWYRANVCFGRLLEFTGDAGRAGDYLRWARSIKNAILRTFWPSTQGVTDTSMAPLTFADRQSGVGDTNYLLAQITPFSFDWRLDTYGNILASLFNVLDVERSRIAFRFMWGVGVNHPFPIANLYPPVQAGDPEWRSYYTVNLLNLPQHYHNGGIWPFVGAQWVRFINHIGYRDIALRELLKLAEINERGSRFDWEFNEWAHGGTGRPMGKCFQAWSCAEFVRAYHDLGLQH